MVDENSANDSILFENIRRARKESNLRPSGSKLNPAGGTHDSAAKSLTNLTTITGSEPRSSQELPGFNRDLTARVTAKPKTPDAGDHLLTVKETAAFLKLSVSGVYHLCETEQLEHYRIGSLIRISRAAIEQLIRNARRAPKPKS